MTLCSPFQPCLPMIPFFLWQRGSWGCSHLETHSYFLGAARSLAEGPNLAHKKSLQVWHYRKWTVTPAPATCSTSKCGGGENTMPRKTGLNFTQRVSLCLPGTGSWCAQPLRGGRPHMQLKGSSFSDTRSNKGLNSLLWEALPSHFGSLGQESSPDGLAMFFLYFTLLLPLPEIKLFLMLDDSIGNS